MYEGLPTSWMWHQASQPINPTYYKSIIKLLRYLTSTQSKILFQVSLINKYMKPSKTYHLKDVKRILWYIKGTINYSIFYL